jgi:hypothetical protein
MENFIKAKMQMVKKIQSLECKNPKYLAFSHPDWCLPVTHQTKSLGLGQYVVWIGLFSHKYQ